MAGKVGVKKLLEGVTAVGSSPVREPFGGYKTFQAWGTTSSGSGSATILVEVTNDEAAPWLTLATIVLTLGTVATSDGVGVDVAWRAMRVRVSAISGTGASVNVNSGELEEV